MTAKKILVSAFAAGLFLAGLSANGAIDLLLRSEKPAGTANNITAAENDANLLAIQNAINSLGTISTQNANAVAITGGSITGLSPPLPVASGGTGAATSAAARTALGAQAANANLDTLASPTYSANTVPLITGSGTATALTVSTAAQALLDDPSSAAMLGTLGAQQSDTELTALAGLTSGADKLPYFTGSGTASTATYTAAARTFDAATDAAGQRTAIGAGTMATQNANAVAVTGGTITGLSSPVPVASGGTGGATASAARTALGAQAQDGELDALATVTSAADTVPMFSGSGTATGITVTSAARSVLDDTTVGGMLNTLGAQPLDSDLTSLANNSTNGALYHTAANTITARTPTCGAGLTCSNLDGVAGAPTFALAAPTTDVFLAADATGITSTTPASVGLTAAVGSGSKYDITCHIFYRINSTASGLTLALTYPTGGVSSFEIRIPGTTADGLARTYEARANSSGTAVTAASTPANGVTMTAEIYGYLKPGSAGNFDVQAASNGTQTATIKEGSNCHIRQLA